MISSKSKALIIVFVLLLVSGIFTVGCKQKAQKPQGWVNTASLPGKTFSNYTAANNTRTNYPGIVYIGNDRSSSPNVNFGPREVSFEMRDLK